MDKEPSIEGGQDDKVITKSKKSVTKSPTSPQKSTKSPTKLTPEPQLSPVKSPAESQSARASPEKSSNKSILSKLEKITPTKSQPGSPVKSASVSQLQSSPTKNVNKLVSAPRTASPEIQKSNTTLKDWFFSRGKTEHSIDKTTIPTPKQEQVSNKIDTKQKESTHSSSKSPKARTNSPEERKGGEQKKGSSSHGIPSPTGSPLISPKIPSKTEVADKEKLPEKNIVTAVQTNKSKLTPVMNERRSLRRSVNDWPSLPHSKVTEDRVDLIAKQTPQTRMHRKASDKSLHNFMAGSHAALTSFTMTGSRYAIQYDTPEREIIEKKIWRKVFPDGTEEAIDFDDALEETSFGAFHVLLYISCGLIYMACSASLSTMSFTLPASTCDLNISSMDKGGINTAPYIGMLIGTFVWGSLSDIKGRKMALMLSLLLDSMAGFLSSFSVNKWMLLFFRAVNGFSIIGATSLVFAFCGEFLTQKQGDLLLPAIEFFFCLGMVYIPVLGYMVIPLKNINIGSTDGFFYHSWNLFTACASIPSFTGLCCMVFFPESPKFTFLMGKLDETLITLQKMYHFNTRKSLNTYPVRCLTQCKEAQELVPDYSFTFMGTVKQHLTDIINSHKELFGGAHLINILLCSSIDFSFNFGYLTLVIWVPELLERMVWYEHNFHKAPTMCEASEMYDPKRFVTAGSECHTITHETYIHAIIITSSSIPVVATAFILLRYIAKNIVLSGLLTITGVSTVLFIHVRDEIILILLCSTFESCATLLETLLFICIVEIFPVQIAGTALAVTACSGRFGAIVGNIYIGNLLDSHCSIPIYSFGTCFFIGAILSLFLRLK